MSSGEVRIQKFRDAYERYAAQDVDEDGVSIHADVSLIIGFLIGGKLHESAGLVLRLYEEARPNDAGVAALKEYMGVKSEEL